jgi:DNA mismatch repair ATPase MutS
MRLRLKTGLVDQALADELSLDKFLAKFFVLMPILADYELAPLEKNEAKKRFNTVGLVLNECKNNPDWLKRALDISAELPQLDFYLNSFQTASIGIQHLVALSRYLQAAKKLRDFESGYLTVGGAEIEDSLRLVVDRVVNQRATGLRASPNVSKKEKELEELNLDVESRIFEQETQVYMQTGLKMLHPFAREIESDEELAVKARDCSWLKTTEQDGQYIKVELKLSADITKLITRKSQLEGEIESELKEHIKKAADEIQRQAKSFEKIYEERKHRCLDYVLANACIQQQLVVPQIHAESSTIIEQGRLSVLKEDLGKKYVPLSVELSKGAQALVGANMTGKTTVLKTVYFLFLLMWLGLPVPAKAMRSFFPRKVKIHLKSSGNVRKNTSSFSDEIRFFAQPFENDEVLLVDELFQTTDPINGGALTKAFVEEFRRGDLLFLCSSHYPEILRVENLNKFQMNDVPLERVERAKARASDLMDEFPYTLGCLGKAALSEKAEEEYRPLKIALLFDLRRGIKERLRDIIKQSTGEG